MQIRFWLQEGKPHTELFSAFWVNPTANPWLHQSDLNTPRISQDTLYWQLNAVFPDEDFTREKWLDVDSILKRIPDWEVRLDNRFVRLEEKIQAGFQPQRSLLRLEDLIQLRVVDLGWLGHFDPHQHLLANRPLRMVGPGHPDFQFKVTLKEWSERYQENWQQKQRQDRPIPWG